MHIPITIQDVAEDLVTARHFAFQAAAEPDPAAQHTKALIASAAAQIALAGATLLLAPAKETN